MSNQLKIKLVFYNQHDLGLSWKKYFEFEENVEIIGGDIMEVDCEALVSPGNSFGFMDGGLDLQISKKYGWDIQKEFQKRISNLPLKELLVGQSETIRVKNSNKLIICAPTMRVPTSDGISNSVNAYLAMKSIMINCLKEKINSVAISGLCTGTGKMKSETCAKQMYQAYCEVVKNQFLEFPNYIDARKNNDYLKL